ncbi:hypothetical protein DSO57_1018232 [Entomophthora muscae]|uniref:Uncharacterized protein n=1 Tax=Entomophthora muscae TaxID=34485 RepID=A0ACC2TS07_9FUNG|nr:hypothetical protein DSO57_1018232 [Entomophthora muscae]
MQNMGSKKPFSKFQQKRPGVIIVLQEEEPKDLMVQTLMKPEPPPTTSTRSEGIFALLSYPAPGKKGPPRRSDRLQARQALAQAISTTIENLTSKPYLLQSVESDDTDSQDNLDNSNTFVNVYVTLPLKTILKVVPGLETSLSLLKEALNPQGIHTTLPMDLHNPILCS